MQGLKKVCTWSDDLMHCRVANYFAICISLRIASPPPPPPWGILDNGDAYPTFLYVFIKIPTKLHKRYFFTDIEKHSCFEQWPMSLK